MNTTNKIKKNSLYSLSLTLPKAFVINEIKQIKNFKYQKVVRILKKSHPMTLCKEFSLDKPINQIVFSPSNDTFSICCDFLIRILKTSSTIKKSFDYAFDLDYSYVNYIKFICFSPCGNFFAFANESTIRFFCIIKYGVGNIGCELSHIIESDHAKHITQLAFSPSVTNKFFSTCSRDKKVKLYELNLSHDLEKEQMTHKLLHTFEEHLEKVLCINFSPTTGNFLASAGVDYNSCIYGVNPDYPDQYCKILYKVEKHTESITSICFSPFEDVFVSGSNDESIILHQISNDCHTNKLKEVNIITINDMKHEIKDVKYSYSGEYIAAASGRTIFLYGGNSKRKNFSQLIFKIENSSPISSISFSLFDLLAASGYDKTIRIYC